MPLDLVDRPGAIHSRERARRQDSTVPFTEAVEPDLALTHVDSPTTFRDPGAAGWPLP